LRAGSAPARRLQPGLRERQRRRIEQVVIANWHRGNEHHAVKNKNRPKQRPIN
jgi:hypothetical protein